LPLDADRNLTHLGESWRAAPIPPEQINAMSSKRTISNWQPPVMAGTLAKIETYLSATFSGAERHVRRLGKIAALELHSGVAKS
jgi:hypothetical protein